jgi:hypothetical protein
VVPDISPPSFWRKTDKSFGSQIDFRLLPRRNPPNERPNHPHV